MLARAFAAAVPAAWVTGDEIYGTDPDLRRWLERADHPYVLAVSCSHPVWHEGQQEWADALVAALSAEAWGHALVWYEESRSAARRLGLPPPAVRERTRDGAVVAHPTQRERAHRASVLPSVWPSPDIAPRAGAGGRDALDHRGELCRRQRGGGTGPVRGAQMDLLVSPHHARPLGPRVPGSNPSGRGKGGSSDLLP
jgi:hypothetical protein